MIWRSPVYKFRLPSNDYADSQKLQEIVIDVTGSAPTFTGPSDALRQVLKEIFIDKSLGRIQSVLEFGAGKLKNIPFILKQGKSVCAVEFKELLDNEKTKENLTKCKKYKRKFRKTIFPQPFISDNNKFDLVLLPNVVPVMPVPAERYYALDLLHKKVNPGKYLLWIAQKEGPYKEIREAGENNCGDGLWMGTNRKVKTFFRYYPVDELDELMALYGFDKVKRFEVPDDARLYKRNGHNILSSLISQNTIARNIKMDNTIGVAESGGVNIVAENKMRRPVIPNPQALSLEELYILKLTKTPAGAKTAELYHRLTSLALGRIFRKSLRNMDIKVPIGGGIKVIDTIFTNSADRGFFHNLRSKVECSYILVEVKNISGDPTNTELDQLNGRLNANRGHFGILLCRNIRDRRAVVNRCKTYLPDHIILVISITDIQTLLRQKRDGEENEIEDFMDIKLREVAF